MVTSVTSLTGNGLKDWLIQRVSAVYLLVYLLVMLIYCVGHCPLTFEVWHGLFQGIGVRIATGIALLMLVLHAWIGIWTVSTDYIRCTCVRLSLQVLVFLFLGAQLIWGFMIVWGQ